MRYIINDDDLEEWYKILKETVPEEAAYVILQMGAYIEAVSPALKRILDED